MLQSFTFDGFLFLVDLLFYKWPMSKSFIMEHGACSLMVITKVCLAYRPGYLGYQISGQLTLVEFNRVIRLVRTQKVSFSENFAYVINEWSHRIFEFRIFNL